MRRLHLGQFTGKLDRCVGDQARVAGECLDGRKSMGLWKRGRRYWTQTVVTVSGSGGPSVLQARRTPRRTGRRQCGSRRTLSARRCKAACRHGHSIKLFAAVDDYLKAKKASANTQRAIEFDRERLEVVKRVLGDVRPSAITARVIEGFQVKRRLEGGQSHGEHGHSSWRRNVRSDQRLEAEAGDDLRSSRLASTMPAVTVASLATPCGSRLPTAQSSGPAVA